MLWLVASVVLLWSSVWLARRLLARPPDVDPLPADPGGPDPGYALHVEDELDLHGVEGREVAELVDAFVEMACERGWQHVKIVHGKGRGVRRQRVRALLARDPRVAEWSDAISPGSGWGATVVHLRSPGSGVASPPRSD